MKTMTSSHKKQNLSMRIVCALVLFIVLFFFVTTIMRAVTNQILATCPDMKNCFTNLLIFDFHDLDGERVNNDSSTKTIKWELLYPFRNEESIGGNKCSKDKNLDKYEDYVRLTENRVERFFKSRCLIGYHIWGGFAKRYERTVHWNYAAYSEYNGVERLPDGHLTSYLAKNNIIDTEKMVDNILRFEDYCQKNSIGFLYVQAPYKISKTQDKAISGALDFSNQNADAIIERLRNAGVNVYDIRDCIEDEKLAHHSLFYATDHHWLAETGLWASRRIAEYLSMNLSLKDVDPAILNEDNFSKTVYPARFLGSKGKKATLLTCKPDDFSVLYPLYKTCIHFSVPDADVDREGDFSVIYNKSEYESSDYYGNEKSPYRAYMFGGHGLTRFENHLATNNVKLLFIHDSFGNTAIPFISLCVHKVDTLDLRHFTGSVQTYIEENKPDVIVVLYDPEVIKLNYDLHRQTFDFR